MVSGNIPFHRQPRTFVTQSKACSPFYNCFSLLVTDTLSHLNMHRAFTRSIPVAATRPFLRPVFRMPSQGENSKIAVRRLHATAQHLKPATALAFTADNYPTSHEKIQDVQDTPYFVDNKFMKSEASQFIELHDPATNNLVTRVPQSTDAELKAAVESAQKAFPAWRATSVMARQQIMFKFTQLVRDNWDRLAASITLEQGKTFAGKSSCYINSANSG